MKKSHNEQVQQFLEKLTKLDNEQYRIVQELRELVFKNFPRATERLMYGGIMFTLKKDFGGVFVSKNHVSIEFGNGYLMADPNKRLEGTGRSRRHLKIRSPEEIKVKMVNFYIKQAVHE